MRLRARQGEKKKGVAGICGIAISTFPPPGTVSTVACKYNPASRIYLSLSLSRSHIFGRASLSFTLYNSVGIQLRRRVTEGNRDS